MANLPEAIDTRKEVAKKRQIRKPVESVLANLPQQNPINTRKEVAKEKEHQRKTGTLANLPKSNPLNTRSEVATEQQGTRSDLLPNLAKSNPIHTRKEEAKEQQIRKPESVLLNLAKQNPIDTRKEVAREQQIRKPESVLVNSPNLKPIDTRKEVAKKRQGTRTDLENIPQNSAECKGETRDQIAKQAEVSPDLFFLLCITYYFRIYLFSYESKRAMQELLPLGRFTRL